MIGACIAELSALGWRVEVVDLGDGFPRPTDAARAAALARLSALPQRRPIVIDGLAFGVLPRGRARIARDPSRGRAGAPSARAGDRARARPRPQRCGRASAPRWPRPVASSRPATRRRALLVADYAVPARSPDRGAAGHRPRRRAAAAARRTGRSARRRRGGAAQGLRRADRGARRARDLPWRLTIVGDASAQPGDRAHGSTADIARVGLARASTGRRGARRATGALLRRRRSVRAAVALRGLRHGLHRGDRARPAGGRHALPAPSRRRCRPAPACWCRPTTSRRSPGRCGA